MRMNKILENLFVRNIKEPLTLFANESTEAERYSFVRQTSVDFT